MKPEKKSGDEISSYIEEVQQPGANRKDKRYTTWIDDITQKQKVREERMRAIQKQMEEDIKSSRHYMDYEVVKLKIMLELPQLFSLKKKKS